MWGVVLGVFLIVLDEFTSLPMPGGYQLALAYVVSVMVHELGHASVGLLAGFRLVACGFWPLAVNRGMDGWRFTPYSVPCAAFVVMLPRGPHELTRRLMLLTGAGPAASALTGIAAASFAVAAPDGIRGFLTAFAGMSALFTVFDFWSFANGAAFSDGARLRNLYRGDAGAERFCSLVLLLGESYSGKRPHEWDAELVRRAARSTGNPSEDLGGLGLHYNWLIATNQIEKAGQVLDSLLGLDVPSKAKQIWALEAAWFQARCRADLPAARNWLSTVSTATRSPEFRCGKAKAVAAIAILERKWSDAEAAAREALKECRRSGDRGIGLAIQEELETLLREIRLQRSGSGTS